MKGVKESGRAVGSVRRTSNLQKGEMIPAGEMVINDQIFNVFEK